MRSNLSYLLKSFLLYEFQCDFIKILVAIVPSGALLQAGSAMDIECSIYRRVNAAWSACKTMAIFVQRMRLIEWLTFSA